MLIRNKLLFSGARSRTATLLPLNAAFPLIGEFHTGAPLHSKGILCGLSSAVAVAAAAVAAAFSAF